MAENDKRVPQIIQFLMTLFSMDHYHSIFPITGKIFRFIFSSDIFDIKNEFYVLAFEPFLHLYFFFIFRDS